MEPLFLVTTSCEFTGAQSDCFPSRLFPPKSSHTGFKFILSNNWNKNILPILLFNNNNILFHAKGAFMSEDRSVISTTHAKQCLYQLKGTSTQDNHGCYLEINNLLVAIPNIHLTSK